MSTAPLPAERTLQAAGLTMVYAVMIGLSDNCVRFVSGDTGLTQFHLIRSVFGLLAIGAAAAVFGLRVAPRRVWAVALRAGFQSFAMILYFAAFALMPVAIAAAGFFTAPVFVLLIGWLCFGERLGGVRLAAVALGMAGVVLVLGPDQFSSLSPHVLLPIGAGFTYAIASIATRRYCAEESATCLLAAFFLGLAFWGLVGLLALTIWPQNAVEGTAGFTLRGATALDWRYLGWMAFHGCFVCLSIALVTRAYLIADPAKVGVLEYLSLPMSGFWGWLMWGDHLGWLAWMGIALITVTGAGLAYQARCEERRVAGAPDLHRVAGAAS